MKQRRSSSQLALSSSLRETSPGAHGTQATRSDDDYITPDAAMRSVPPAGRDYCCMALCACVTRACMAALV